MTTGLVVTSCCNVLHREAELSAMRQCGLCATVAPLGVGQATIPLQLRDGQVSTWCW